MARATSGEVRFTPPSTMQIPERILVRLPNWVGDLVMCTPALRALRLGFPGAKITAEGRPQFRDLVVPLETVDDYLPYTGRSLPELRARVRNLRAGRFDLALLLAASQSAALGPFLARIPRRVGYASDFLRRLLISEALAPPGGDRRRVPVSMIEWYLRLTRQLGCADAGDGMSVPLTDRAAGSVSQRLKRAGIAAEAPVLLAIPGASFGSSKMWPTGHFATACGELAKKHGLRTVIAPGPGEEPVARRVADEMGRDCVVLTDPLLDLPELAAMVHRSTLVLTNDTGPRQLAVAFEVPCVVVIGPSDPRTTQHQMRLQRVLSEPVDCAPCGLERCPIDHRCLTRLHPDRVIAAADDLLACAHPSPTEALSPWA